VTIVKIHQTSKAYTSNLYRVSPAPEFIDNAEEQKQDACEEDLMIDYIKEISKENKYKFGTGWEN